MNVRTARGGTAVTRVRLAPARASGRPPVRPRRPQPGGGSEADEEQVGHAGHSLPPHHGRAPARPRGARVRRRVTGTLINVATILLGTLVGTLLGSRLPQRLQDRVLAGLGLVTLVIGVELALTWRDTNTLFVLGGVLLGGIVGEGLRIEERLERLGDRLQAVTTREGATGSSTVSEAFFTASLLFCVGPLTVVGAIQDGLTGDYEALATKAVLDGFAAIAIAASLGPGVAFAAVSVLVVQGGSPARPLRGDPRGGLGGARRALERGRRADHRDRAAAPVPHRRQGRQLPAGARLRAGPRGALEPLVNESHLGEEVLIATSPPLHRGGPQCSSAPRTTPHRRRPTEMTFRKITPAVATKSSRSSDSNTGRRRRRRPRRRNRRSNSNT